MARGKRKSTKLAVARGKRKMAIARAYVRKGKGVVRINGHPLDAIDNAFVRNLIKESLRIADKYAKGVDIEVKVRGGGVIGQAQAARTAIAKALVEYTGKESLWDQFYEYDKFMVVEDSRRVEPKKYKGPKARARFLSLIHI